MQYRREIDGLRALAVLPVILFHGGFTLFSGGYIGVDIFFVISGYLITTIILQDLQAGRFSLASFYERRARRILPALFVVAIACLPFAWFWLPPDDMKDFADSLMAVSVFASNLLFWQQSDYFATAAELKPLLHTWSLAVEEQFYLLFPLALMALWRQRLGVALLIAAVVASLALAHWGVYREPSATFYLLPTRLWELGIGALVAVYLFHRDRVAVATPLAGALGTLGLLMIAGAIFAFDNTTPFPSLYALVPTLGTALVILFAQPDNLAGRLLGSRLLVGIGLVSYSAYLWHQPLFAFARFRTLGESGHWLFGGLAIAALALAYLTWRFVESPCRRKGRFSRPAVFTSAAGASLVLIAIGAAGKLSDGFADREILPPEITASFARSARKDECFGQNQVHRRPDWTCRLGDPDATPSFFVFGDSHALSFVDVYHQVAKAEGRAGLFAGTIGCAPLLGVHSLRSDQDKRNCFQLNERVRQTVAEMGIDKLILIGRWTFYTDGDYEQRDLSFLGLSPGDDRDIALSRAAFRHGLAETARQYRQLGVTVHVHEQVPHQLYHPKRIYLKALADGTLSAGEIAALSVPTERHRALQSFVRTAFAEPGLDFRFMAVDDLLCNTEGRCPVGDEEGSFYFDDDHLSNHGTELLRERVRSVLRQ